MILIRPAFDSECLFEEKDALIPPLLPLLLRNILRSREVANAGIKCKNAAFSAK